MRELCDAKVRGETGLSTLLADKADANVGRLDHRDVVATVSNGADDGLGVRLEEFGDARLLGGRGAANDHGGTLANQVEEFVLVVP